MNRGKFVFNAFCASCIDDELSIKNTMSMSRLIVSWKRFW